MVLAAVVLVIAACSDDGGGDADDATEDTEAPAPEVTDAGDGEATTPTTTAETEASPVEDSPVAAVLEEAYGAPGAEPILEPGTAGVLWYDGGETWVAVFVGADLDALGPLCPGSSLETGPGTFEFVSNTPTEEGACEGFTNPEASVRRCGTALVYESLIPMDATGTLYGSIERAADGGIEGITSMVDADASSASPIDLAATAYDTPDGIQTCE